MNNWEHLISDIKKEYNDLPVNLSSQQIINNYQAKKLVADKRQIFISLKLVTAFSFCLVIFISFSLFFNIKKQNINDTYAYYAATVANYVASYSDNELKLSNENNLYSDITSKINQYLLIINENMSGTKLSSDEQKINDEQYDYLLKINSAPISGVNMSYVLYYNKTNIQDKYYNIQGIMPIKNKCYHFEGNYDDAKELVTFKIFKDSQDELIIRQNNKNNIFDCTIEEQINNQQTITRLNLEKNQLQVSIDDQFNFIINKDQHGLVMDVYSNFYDGKILVKMLSLNYAEYFFDDNQSIIKKII